MEELGYGEGYQYDHDHEGAVAPQDYLPEPLEGRTFYRPADRGTEKRIRRRLEEIRELRSRGREGGGEDGAAAGDRPAADEDDGGGD
jgi:putative ATPase